MFEEFLHIQTKLTDNLSRCQKEKEQHVTYPRRGDGSRDSDCPQRKEKEAFKVDKGLIAEKGPNFTYQLNEGAEIRPR